MPVVRSGGNRKGPKGKRPGKAAVRRGGARPAARPLRGAKTAPSSKVARARHTLRRAKSTRASHGHDDARVVFRVPELLEEAERLDFVSEEMLRGIVDPDPSFLDAARAFSAALERVRTRIVIPARMQPETIARLIGRVELLMRLEEEAEALHRKYVENRRKVVGDLARLVGDSWAVVQVTAGRDGVVAEAFRSVERLLAALREKDGAPTPTE